MLFDLRSPRRRRLVQVIYGTLAVLMGGGLVFFGIGSDTTGGLFDAFSSDSGGGSVSSELTDQAERIEQKLRRDPENEDLLLTLVRVRYAAGNSVSTTDPTTGAPSIPEEGQAEFDAAASAWERYLRLRPAEPNPNVANLAAVALFNLAFTSTSASDVVSNMKDAARAQAIVAAARPSLGSLSTLAQYQYYALAFEAGDATAKRAAAEGQTKPEREQIAADLANHRRFGKQIEKQQKAEARSGQQELQNPLGGP
jgi:hypothetical protein